MSEKVLIVDDQEINRDMLAGILYKSYELTLASNGLEALEALGEDGNGISIVLLDLKMPEMNGFQFLEQVNANGLIKKIPVVVISSEDDNETENECLQLNVTDFIRKPFDNLTVRRRVENIINLFNAQHNLQKQVD